MVLPCAIGEAQFANYAVPYLCGHKGARGLTPAPRGRAPSRVDFRVGSLAYGVVGTGIMPERVGNVNRERRVTIPLYISIQSGPH